MGLTYVDGIVTGPSGESRSVRFLVDSGAKYSLLPVDDWRAIGLTPERRMTFVLADGTQIQREVSECYLELPQGKGHSLGLIFHPFSRTLHPARMLLASVN